MKLEEAKDLYPGEWIAFRSQDDSENPEGEVLLHHKDQRVFDEELLKRKLAGIYITFAGPPIPDGYGTLL